MYWYYKNNLYIGYKVFEKNLFYKFLVLYLFSYFIHYCRKGEVKYWNFYCWLWCNPMTVKKLILSLLEIASSFEGKLDTHN